jgi:predicted AAA+ superfamily ATPase
VNDPDREPERAVVSFASGYQRRVVDDELDQLFAELPALLLDGPKGVGKTATATRRCATVRQLDVPNQAQLLAADPTILADDPPPVLIDEWQRVPAVWDALRRLVDDNPTGGRFLLTGSAPRAGTHSGAGRIADLRLRPLCLGERLATPHSVSFRSLLDGNAGRVTGSSPLALGDYVDEIIAGGFPGMRHLTGRALTTQLDGYVRRIVDHDLAEAGAVVRRPAAVLAWLKAYAAATATTASWEKIRDAATSGVADKPARATTSGYTELLTALRILDPIDAWVPSRNQFDRLGSAAKHHLADPALAVRLLQRTRRHLLTDDAGSIVVPHDGTMLGNLFESLVALSIRTYAQSAGADVHHLRTAGGRHEVDFIVETEGRILAIEAKLGRSIDDADVRHLHWLRERLGDDLVDAVVITTGSDAYRRRDGIAVVPLGLLGQ